MTYQFQVINDSNVQEYVNSLPDNTGSISLIKRGLTFIPDLSRFVNLKELYCSYNLLTRIPKLPESLQYVSCEYNQLNYLPDLPESLTHLTCSYNQLTYLPNLPYALKSINCQNNKLTSLPGLPGNLCSLYCQRNKLTSLPNLPHSLEHINCCQNNLTCFPNLPNNLYSLNCSQNNLNVLPNLPETLQVIYYYNPINVIIELTNDIDILKKNIVIHNKFIYLYHCLKLKKQFRKWLWERVRLPKIQKEFEPHNIIDTLYYEIEDDIII